MQIRLHFNVIFRWLSSLGRFHSTGYWSGNTKRLRISQYKTPQHLKGNLLNNILIQIQLFGFQNIFCSFVLCSKWKENREIFVFLSRKMNLTWFQITFFHSFRNSFHLIFPLFSWNVLSPKKKSYLLEPFFISLLPSLKSFVWGFEQRWTWGRCGKFVIYWKYSLNNSAQFLMNRVVILKILSSSRQKMKIVWWGEFEQMRSHWTALLGFLEFFFFWLHTLSWSD